MRGLVGTLVVPAIRTFPFQSSDLFVEAAAVVDDGLVSLGEERAHGYLLCLRLLSYNPSDGEKVLYLQK